MKRSLLLTIFTCGISLFSTEQSPILLVSMPELPTNFAVVDEPVEGPEGTLYQARIYTFDGGIVSEFTDCVGSGSADEATFRCVKGDEQLTYFKEEIHLLSWQTPTQMEIFESMAKSGRFEQTTAYVLKLFKTARGTFSVSIGIDDLYEDIYSTCEGMWLENHDMDAEIYCVNKDGTDVLIFVVKEEDKLVLTGMWSTPALADDQTYFQGEIPLLAIADMIY